MQEQLTRTIDDFTTGIVNLPILLDNNTNKPIMEYNQDKKRFKYKVIQDMRYPFFELDTKDEKPLYKVLDAYAHLDIPVYVHETMRGYHFLSLHKLHKIEYAEWIRPLMKLNPKCPMVTLRIKPNKWIGEKEVFRKGNIIHSEHDDFLLDETRQLKMWIERQHIGLLQCKYYIVKYRMTGEAGNL